MALRVIVCPTILYVQTFPGGLDVSVTEGIVNPVGTVTVAVPSLADPESKFVIVSV